MELRLIKRRNRLGPLGVIRRRNRLGPLGVIRRRNRLRPLTVIRRKSSLRGIGRWLFLMTELTHKPTHAPTPPSFRSGFRSYPPFKSRVLTRLPIPVILLIFLFISSCP